MDPSAQGRGLGRTLLLAGLEYLQRAGAETVILYTDEENQGAVRLYEKTGFVITRRQTQYRRPDAPARLTARHARETPRPGKRLL